MDGHHNNGRPIRSHASAQSQVRCTDTTQGAKCTTHIEATSSRCTILSRLPLPCTTFVHSYHFPGQAPLTHAYHHHNHPLLRKAVDESLINEWLAAPTPPSTSGTPPSTPHDPQPPSHRQQPQPNTDRSSSGTSPSYSLFAYPAEDNFAGVKFPLEWASAIKKRNTEDHKWMVRVGEGEGEGEIDRLSLHDVLTIIVHRYPFLCHLYHLGREGVRVRVRRGVGGREGRWPF